MMMMMMMTCFLQSSAVRHLKTLPYGKKLTIYLNSAQKMGLGLHTLLRVTDNKNYFVMECNFFAVVKIFIFLCCIFSLYTNI